MNDCCSPSACPGPSSPPPVAGASTRSGGSASTATLVGGIVSALVASVCCIGPLVFALLGLSGAGLLLKFEPYRPYFIVLTFAFLGGAFYLTYRRKPTVECAPGSACVVPGSRRLQEIVLWIVSFVVVAIVTFPYYAGWLLG